VLHGSVMAYKIYDPITNNRIHLWSCNSLPDLSRLAAFLIMKNSIKSLFVVVPLLLAGSVSAYTLKVYNFDSVPTNYPENYPEMQPFYNFPVGLTTIELSGQGVYNWNNWGSYQIDGEHDWYVVFSCGQIWDFGQSEVIPVGSESSIQEAFNQGLYWSAAVVGVLLAFSIIRTIPGGGQEEI